MQGRIEESSSNELTDLHDELLKKIWIEHLKPHDRFSLAITSKNFLCLFKSASKSASYYDLQQQLSRVGLSAFLVTRLTGIDQAVIDRLTTEFSEEFRSLADIQSYNSWLLSDEIKSIKNPHFWRLALALVLLDMHLPALPQNYCQFVLTENDLPFCFELISISNQMGCSFSKLAINDLKKLIATTSKNNAEQTGYHFHALLSDVLASLMEAKAQSMHSPEDFVRKLKFPKNFNEAIARDITYRMTLTDAVAEFIVSQLQQCSPEQIERINYFHQKEYYANAYRSHEKWNEYLVAFARYMRIFLPLDNLLSQLTSADHKKQIHEFYMYRHHHYSSEITRLRQQQLIDHIFPLLHQLRLTYPALEDGIFLTAYVYCLNDTSFFRKIELLPQFIKEMWQLKNNYPDLFTYINRELSLNFGLGISIGYGHTREFIELLTPYLARGTVQPVLTNHLSILNKITTYGYHFARSVSYLSRFYNCLAEIGTLHPGLVLSEQELDTIFVLIPEVYHDKDVVTQLFANRKTECHASESWHPVL